MKLIVGDIIAYENKVSGRITMEVIMNSGQISEIEKINRKRFNQNSVLH